MNERIGNIITLGARVENGKQLQKEFAATITGFQKNTPTWVPGALKAVKFVIDANPFEASGLKEATDIVVDSALAIAGTFGDDIVDEAVEKFGAPEKEAKPPASSISFPKLTSTTADFGAMKVKAIGSLNISPPPSITGSPKKG